MEQWEIEQENQRLQNDIAQRNAMFKIKIKRKIDAITRIQRAWRRRLRFKKFGVATECLYKSSQQSMLNTQNSFQILQQTNNLNIPKSNDVDINTTFGGYNQISENSMIEKSSLQQIQPFISSKKVQKIKLDHINFSESYKGALNLNTLNNTNSNIKSTSILQDLMELTDK